MANPCERIVSVPPLRGTQVLVKTLASGLCHSDIHAAIGDLKHLPIALPITLGHEAAGEVVAIGPEARGVKVGDKVVVWPWLSHETEKYPASIGLGFDGGFSTHVLVPEDQYCVPFGKIPIQQAALLACSGITSYTALKSVKPILQQQGKRYLVVIGAGGLGLQAVRFCKAVTGVAPIVCDIDSKKLEVAKKLGPEGTLTVNISDPNALQTIVAITGGQGGGPDAVIDFVGSNETATFGFQSLCTKLHRGLHGKYVGVGLYGGQLENIPIMLLVVFRIVIEGSLTGCLEDMKELIQVAQNIPPLPIQEVDLNVKEVNLGLENLKNSKVQGRVVFCARL